MARTCQTRHDGPDRDVSDVRNFFVRHPVQFAQDNGFPKFCGYSFDKKGVHFVGVNNVLNIREGGLGVIGAEQLEWLKKDLEPLSSSTPIVVFAHIPLWAVYPQWGWGTDDAEQALGFLRRFGSVTVLNGHIHQIVKKVEGNITFHTAMSTAFPQPAPGAAPKPGPMKVEAERLSSLLGVTDVNFIEGNHTLAVVDSTLA